MALAFSVIDAGYVQENLSTYSTTAGVGLTHVVGDGLVTFVSGRLYYVIIAADRSGGGSVASISQDPDGTPLSLSLVTGATQATPVGDGRTEVWKVVPGSTTADARLSIVMSPGSHSQCIWCVLEVTGFDGSGTEVQVVKSNGTASPASITMASYGATDNAILSVVALAEFATGETITGEHTELADLDDNERMQLMVQVNNPHASDLTPSATYTQTASEEWAEIGIEVKASAASVTYEQEGFQFYLDDNNESSATPVGSQDANMTAPTGENRRLRILLNNTGDAPGTAYRLEYRRVGAGSWKVVGPPPVT